jgi:4,5-dihydroxyphthalate decarboxylase
MTVSLSLACVDYEWLEPLIRGDVTPDGIELTVLSGLSSGERHGRMAQGEFDAAEFSLGRYISGWPDWDFVAIPVFPRRFFPHSRTYVNAEAGITEPSDLAGKRVGIVSYRNTLALWAKGVYAEQYGLDLEEVTWCVAGRAPASVDVPIDAERINRDDCVEALSDGVIDALIWPRTDRFIPRPANVELLFSDLQDAEGEYYDRTGFYPVMHNVVIDQDVVDEHPWVPTELMRAFRASHERFAERARFDGKYPLVWWQSYLQNERERFGDIWARSYSLGPNAEEVETLIRYTRRQGLTDGEFEADDIFLRPDEHLDRDQ